MKITTEITKTITAKEGKSFLTFKVKGEKITGVNSNLQYEKTIEDFDFYARAIKKLLKEIGGKTHIWKRYNK